MAGKDRAGDKVLRDLPDVGYTLADGDAGDVTAARFAHQELVAQGVEFYGSDHGTVPWLVAEKAFELGEDLTRRIHELGGAVFQLVDAAQVLYAEGHERVREHLDIGILPGLRGLDLDRMIQMFRLDVVVRDGKPVLTEIEEVFGNVGKAHAFEFAYGVPADPMFKAFEGYEFERIWLDDQYHMYRSELAIVAQRMKTQFGRDVEVEFLSKFKDDGRRVGWRFCYVKEFRQYESDVRKSIIAGADRLVNPLFHGYGTKGLISLAWDPEVEGELVRRIGRDTLDILREGMPDTQLLDPIPDPDFMEGLKSRGKGLALKVLDSPEATEYTWGSRGVFFGDQSRWRKSVDAAAIGSVPGRDDVRNTRYMLTELIDSDRYDINFLHPRDNVLCTMPRARVRLTPIFNREPDGWSLLGGHATFVNTSRKVHLGKHAVCAPFSTSQAAHD
ncbi:hypothetical protein [Streptomyces sp. V3I7]|uniref:hypothetical protein n=1 Tax=Streptomyces sp. V3I7 TaxID=3042278 RepID=UPI002781F1A5|nr:hypothetical protein [Streptomyces sp. V3I7]MDQ0993888.1 hypothetical protein [Streptomyces sp. V3I7]